MNGFRDRFRSMRPAFWLRRALILLLVVAVCAFVPTAIKSHRAAVASREPSVLPQLASADPTATGDPVPTDESVRQLSTTVIGRAAKGYDLPVSAAVSKVSTVPGKYRRLGRVEIPAIGLKTQFGEGVYEKTLNRGAGHWPGTPLPGSVGNSVLSGHRNTHTQPFKELDELRHGDKITVFRSSRASTTYRVFKTTIVRERKFKDFVLRQPEAHGAREITLFACHPEGNPTFRIVVQGRAEPRK